MTKATEVLNMLDQFEGKKDSIVVNDRVTLKIEKKDVWWGDDEYQVVYMLDGKRNEERTYYTDDRQDAIETMKATAKRIKSGKEKV